MSEMTPFNFENLNVRVVTLESEPWFVAADVCRVLEIAEPHRATASLDDDEKGRHIMTTPGGRQNLTVISEPALYKLIGRSRKPEAKRFDRWVRHEVLPAIRKTGGYIQAAPDESPEALILRAMTVLQDTVERQKRQLAETQPKADGFDLIADANGSLNLTETAKALQTPPQAFIRTLAAEGIIYKRRGNNNWLGAAQYVNAGYVVHKASTVYTPWGGPQIMETVRVTPRGLTWLARRQVRRAAA